MEIENGEIVEPSLMFDGQFVSMVAGKVGKIWQ
jgi:hypothetical protein